ncbi:unnamed protein product [Pylaiella littoralis]
MMGVLKVVLPVLGMVQIVLAFLYADPGFQTMMFELLFGGNTRGADRIACKVLMELLCPLFLGMAFLNICSWTMGSTMRPKVAVSDLISHAGVLVVHYRHSGSFPSNSIPVWVCTVAILAVVVGLVLHQLEPGLLTEDKAIKTAARTPKKSNKYA